MARLEKRMEELTRYARNKADGFMRDVALGSQNISSNVNELTSMATNLKQMVEKFKI